MKSGVVGGFAFVVAAVLASQSRDSTAVLIVLAMAIAYYAALYELRIHRKALTWFQEHIRVVPDDDFDMDGDENDNEDM